jgi:hypothetical protein
LCPPLDPAIELGQAIQKLLQVIAPGHGPNPPPILFLAYDEAHTLCREIPGEQSGSQFKSLRLASWAMKDFPVWSLFLSTTGKLEQFSPPSHLEDSSRLLMGTLTTALPFSVLGFDHLAELFCDDGTMTLDYVSSLKFRLSLGRPL